MKSRLPFFVVCSLLGSTCKSSDKDLILKTGNELMLTVDFPQHESVSGLNRVDKVTAVFIPEGAGGQTVLAVDTFGNDNWEDEIETLGVSFKGVSISDIEDPIHARVRILPVNAPALAGKTGVIKFHFLVTYPKMMAVDHPLYRSLAEKIDILIPYYDSTTVIEYETSAIIK